MAILSFAIPVPPGKIKDLEQHLAEATKHEDLDEAFRSQGISRESWHLQQTPQGDLLILVFDCDDPLFMLKEYSESERPILVWQRKCLKDILGIDLSDPPPGPPSTLLFDWP